jgi:thioesterase domain-containing protein
VGGTVFSYAELARALGRPFYGIQTPGLENGRPAADLAAMAAEYVAAVRGVQPKGPYLLGGWSFGGVVAYEMACQLRESGEEVALLALFDSWAPDGDGLPDERGEEDLLRFFLLDQAKMQGKELPAPEDGAPDLPPERRIERLLGRAREAGLLKADVRPEQVQRLLGVYKANLLALASYRPRPYAGPLVLFRPEGIRPDGPLNGLNGWEAFAAGVIDVQPVAGDHYHMLAPPQVSALAERLKACIDGARK